jgi:hypothetical protein
MPRPDQTEFHSWDPHAIGLDRDAELTPEQMNALPTDALIRFAFSSERHNARRERKRLAALEQERKSPEVFTAEQLQGMSFSELIDRGFGSGLITSNETNMARGNQAGEDAEA